MKSYFTRPGHYTAVVLRSPDESSVFDFEFPAWAVTEGWNAVSYFQARVQHISVRTESYTMSSTYGEGKVRGDDSVGAISKDGLPMKADVTIAYRIVASDVPNLYRYFGNKIENELIRPASRTAMNETLSEYLAIEAYAKKRQFIGPRMAVLIRTHLDRILHNRNAKLLGIQIVRVMVSKIDPPDKIKEAIQLKLTADQEAQRMEFVLDKERKERDRKEIEAQGIKRFQDIVRQGIDEQLLRWKGIEATMSLASSPNAKIIVIGGKDGMPLILNSK